MAEEQLNETDKDQGAPFIVKNMAGTHSKKRKLNAKCC